MGNQTDPILKHPTWRTAVAYWQARATREQLYCARCGGAIRTGGKRGPWHLDVGHITSRQHARAQGWPVEQINALANTQPEHARCSRSAGATQGNASRAPGTVTPTITSGTW